MVLWSRWISIKQENSKLILEEMYTEPQGDILENILTTLDLNKTHLYIIGDINIDFKDKKHPATKKIMEFIRPFGLNQIIKKNQRDTPKIKIVLLMYL